jgi:hypothetical protein
MTIDSFDFDVVDYVTTESSIILDLKFYSEAEFNNFNKNVFEFHNQANSSLDFAVDNVKYSGFFSLFIYDKDYNARAYLTYENPGSAYTAGTLLHNMFPVLNNHEKRISYLIDVLSRKNIISEEELKDLTSYLPYANNKMDLHYQVADLSSYLLARKMDMAHLREEFTSSNVQ